MRKFQFSQAFCFFLCLFFTTTESKSNVIGVDAQNFNATTDGLDFVTVQSSETLHPGIFNLGLFANYAVNSLPYFPAETSTSKDFETNDRIATLDFNFGVGLMNNWDMGMSIPQIVYQKVQSEEFHGEFVQRGITELRWNTKFRLFGDDSGGLAFIGSVNYNLIQDNPYTGSNSFFIYNGEIAMDTTIQRLALGLNLGYRKRNPGERLTGSPILPMKDQYIASAAASFHFPSIHTKFIGETFGAWPTKKLDNRSDRQNSSLESLFGIKHDATSSLALHMGIGTELQHGIASPDWRAYAGLNYVFGPVFADETKAVKRPRKNKPKDEEPKQNPFAGPVERGEETIIVHDIHFAFDRDDKVLPGSKEILRQFAEYLHMKPAYQSLVIEGHTDSYGSDEYNQNLSERRAATIRRYLIEVHKEDPNKITSVGKGEKFPIGDNGNYQGRRLNRRVEFKITR